MHTAGLGCRPTDRGQPADGGEHCLVNIETATGSETWTLAQLGVFCGELLDLLEEYARRKNKL